MAISLKQEIKNPYIANCTCISLQCDIHILELKIDIPLYEFYKIEATIKINKQLSKKNLNSIFTITIGNSDQKTSQTQQTFVGALTTFEKINYDSEECVYIYKILLYPELFKLNFEQKFRIFQDQNKREIIKTILRESNIEFINKINSSTKVDETNTQFQETTLDYLIRLMQEEKVIGFYDFNNKCTYTLIDDINQVSNNFKLTVPEQIDQSNLFEEIISQKSIANSVINNVKVFNYNYSDADNKIVSEKKQSSIGNSNMLSKTQLEVFANNKNQKQSDAMCGNILNQEIEEIVEIESTSIKGLVGSFVSCYSKNKLNEKLFVVKNQIHIFKNERNWIYKNKISAFLEFVYRVTKKKPIINSTQSAKVIGDKINSDINVDNKGRIKVKFFWDNVSAWIRVMQWGSAGNGWGNSNFPRVDQEVIVSFINGDVDQPIVLGTIYNSTNENPLELSKQSMNFIIKQKSHMSANFNPMDYAPDADELMSGFLSSQINQQKNKLINTVVDNTAVIKDQTNIITDSIDTSALNKINNDIIQSNLNNDLINFEKLKIDPSITNSIESLTPNLKPDLYSKDIMANLMNQANGLNLQGLNKFDLSNKLSLFERLRNIVKESRDLNILNNLDDIKNKIASNIVKADLPTPQVAIAATTAVAGFFSFTGFAYMKSFMNSFLNNLLKTNNVSNLAQSNNLINPLDIKQNSDNLASLFDTFLDKSLMDNLNISNLSDKSSLIDSIKNAIGGDLEDLLGAGMALSAAGILSSNFEDILNLNNLSKDIFPLDALNAANLMSLDINSFGSKSFANVLSGTNSNALDALNSKLSESSMFDMRYNEISMTNQYMNELINIRSNKNISITSLRDLTETIKNNRITKITKNDNYNIAGNRYETFGNAGDALGMAKIALAVSGDVLAGCGCTDMLTMENGTKINHIIKGKIINMVDKGDMSILTPLGTTSISSLSYNLFVIRNASTSISGNNDTKISGANNTTVKGNNSLSVQGKYQESVDGIYETSVKGKYDLTCKGPVSVSGAKVDIKSDANINIETNGMMKIKANVLNIEAIQLNLKATAIKIEAQGILDIQASAIVKIKGALVQLG